MSSPTMSSTSKKRAASPDDAQGRFKRQSKEQGPPHEDELQERIDRISAEQSEILEVVEQLLRAEHLWERRDSPLVSRARRFLTVLESQCRAERWGTDRSAGIASILFRLRDVLHGRRNDDLTKHMLFGYVTGFTRGMQVLPPHKAGTDMQDEDNTSVHLFHRLQKRIIALTEVILKQLQDLARPHNAEGTSEASEVEIVVPESTFNRMQDEIASCRQDLAELVSQSARDMKQVQDAHRNRCDVIKLRYLNTVQAAIDEVEEEREELQEQNAKLQEQNAKLQEQNAKLRVKTKKLIEQAKQTSTEKNLEIKEITEKLTASDGLLAGERISTTQLKNLLSKEQSRAGQLLADLDAAHTDADAMKQKHKNAISIVENTALEKVKVAQTQGKHYQKYIECLGIQVQTITKERDNAVSEQAYIGHVQEGHHRMHMTRSKKLEDREKAIEKRERDIAEREQALASREDYSSQIEYTHDELHSQIGSLEGQSERWTPNVEGSAMSTSADVAEEGKAK